MNCTRYQMAQIVADRETIVAGIAGRYIKVTEPCLVNGEPAWEFMGEPIKTSGGVLLNTIKDKFLQPMKWRTA